MSKISFVPVTEFSPDMVRALFINFQLLENGLRQLSGDDNIIDGSIQTGDLADLAVTLAKIANSAVSYAKTNGEIAGIARGRYTGDGTANREINLGWRPKYVMILKLDDSKIFESIDDGVAVSTWWRDSAGALNSGTTNWQGVSANGFTGGSNSASTSNTNAINYSYIAWR